MKIEFAQNTEILVFTGPESSGKTTCAARIAKEYQLPLVEEYAREYLIEHGTDYTFEDIFNIALHQVKEESKANQNNSLIVCDTDIVTLEIWALEKYRCSLGYKDTLIDKKHYLLCYPDIPWEADPLRENPEDRVRLFDRYEQFLKDLKASYTTLREKDRNQLQLIK